MLWSRVELCFGMCVLLGMTLCSVSCLYPVSVHAVVCQSLADGGIAYPKFKKSRSFGCCLR